MTNNNPPLDAAAITDWLEALKSRSESPEVIALQRDLLALLQRAARQLPEVQALVLAAGELLNVLDEADKFGEVSFDTMRALREALRPFDDKDD